MLLRIGSDRLLARVEPFIDKETAWVSLIKQTKPSLPGLLQEVDHSLFFLRKRQKSTTSPFSNFLSKAGLFDISCLPLLGHPKTDAISRVTPAFSLPLSPYLVNHHYKYLQPSGLSW